MAEIEEAGNSAEFSAIENLKAVQSWLTSTYGRDVVWKLLFSYRPSGTWKPKPKIAGQKWIIITFDSVTPGRNFLYSVGPDVDKKTLLKWSEIRIDHICTADGG